MDTLFGTTAGLTNKMHGSFTEAPRSVHGAMGKQGQIRTIPSQSGINREEIGIIYKELGSANANRIFKNMSSKMPQRGVQKPPMHSSSGLPVNCKRSRDDIDNYKQSDKNDHARISGEVQGPETGKRVTARS